MDVNYYEVLGIDNTATQNDIRSAYHSLSKKYHPDVNDSQNASVIFRMINEAYNKLINPDTRADYDTPPHQGGVCDDEDDEDGDDMGMEGETLSDLSERPIYSVQFVPKRPHSAMFKLLTFVPILLLRALCLVVLLAEAFVTAVIYLISLIASWIGIVIFIISVVYGIFYFFGNPFTWHMLWTLLLVAGAGFLIPVICVPVSALLISLLKLFHGYTFSPFWSH